MKRYHPRLSQLHLWLVGLWSFSGVDLYYPPREPSVLSFFATCPSPMTDTDTATGIIGKLQALLPELCQLVASYCPESPLWRYGIAATGPPAVFYNLKESKTVMLSLHELPYWIRGTTLSVSRQLTLTERRYVRITLDDDGILELEFLEEWPKADWDWVAVRDRWYIVEEFDKLAKFQFQSRVNYIPSGICFC